MTVVVIFSLDEASNLLCPPHTTSGAGLLGDGLGLHWRAFQLLWKTEQPSVAFSTAAVPSQQAPFGSAEKL